jgi:malonyl-CoA O-methyltransferase
MMNDARTISAEVSDRFGRAAQRYAQYANVQADMAEWLAEWLPAERAGRALELGAGTGMFTRKLLPWLGTLTATDASAAMCEVAQVQLPDVEWRVLNAEAPGAAEADWIFTSSMLQWVENPRAMFAAWKRAMRPGGRVLAGLFAEGSLPELRELTHGWSPLTWRTPDEWSELLAEAGLELVRSEEVYRVFYHPTAREFLRSLHGVGATPYHQFTPGKLRRILRDYDKLHREPQGVRSTWVFYRIEATLRTA